MSSVRAGNVCECALQRDALTEYSLAECGLAECRIGKRLHSIVKLPRAIGQRLSMVKVPEHTTLSFRAQTLDLSVLWLFASILPVRGSVEDLPACLNRCVQHTRVAVVLLPQFDDLVLWKS